MPKHKTEYIQVCPKCKSADIGSDTQTNPLQAIGAPGMQVCNACGHLGRMFPEVVIAELKEIRKMPEEHPAGKDKPPLVDLSYGMFEIKWMWKFAPLIVIVSAYGIFKGIWPLVIFLPLGLWMTYVTYFKKVGSL